MVEVPREISEKIKNKKEAREAKLPGLKLVKSNLEMMNLISLLRYISNNIQVVSVDPVGKKARVVLGDQTAIVKAFLFNDECIKEGNTIVIFKAEAAVIK